MKHDLIENNLNNYINSFREDPTLYADILTPNDIKQYGISNNDFWKKFIINLDDKKIGNFLKDNGLYKYLARIYFITHKGQKLYLIEKLPPATRYDKTKIDELATELGEQNIVVDKNSAVLVDKTTNNYKFKRYKISKDV